MNVDISPAGIVLGLFNLLLLCLAFFVKQWMARSSAEIESVKSKVAQLTHEFHAHQLKTALEFAQKADVNDGRKEVLEALTALSNKVDRITDKLDKKADKP